MKFNINGEHDFLHGKQDYTYREEGGNRLISAQDCVELGKLDIDYYVNNSKESLLNIVRVTRNGETTKTVKNRKKSK